MSDLFRYLSEIEFDRAVVIQPLRLLRFSFIPGVGNRSPLATHQPSPAMSPLDPADGATNHSIARLPAPLVSAARQPIDARIPSLRQMRQASAIAASIQETHASQMPERELNTIPELTIRRTEQQRAAGQKLAPNEAMLHPLAHQAVATETERKSAVSALEEGQGMEQWSLPNAQPLLPIVNSTLAPDQPQLMAKPQMTTTEPRPIDARLASGVGSVHSPQRIESAPTPDAQTTEPRPIDARVVKSAGNSQSVLRADGASMVDETSILTAPLSRSVIASSPVAVSHEDEATAARSVADSALQANNDSTASEPHPSVAYSLAMHGVTQTRDTPSTSVASSQDEIDLKRASVEGSVHPSTPATTTEPSPAIMNLQTKLPLLEDVTNPQASQRAASTFVPIQSMSRFEANAPGKAQDHKDGTHVDQPTMLLQGKLAAAATPMTATEPTLPNMPSFAPTPAATIETSAPSVLASSGVLPLRNDPTIMGIIEPLTEQPSSLYHRPRDNNEPSTVPLNVTNARKETDFGTPINATEGGFGLESASIRDNPPPIFRAGTMSDDAVPKGYVDENGAGYRVQDADQTIVPPATTRLSSPNAYNPQPTIFTSAMSTAGELSRTQSEHDVVNALQPIVETPELGALRHEPHDSNRSVSANYQPGRIDETQVAGLGDFRDRLPLQQVEPLLQSLASKLRSAESVRVAVPFVDKPVTEATPTIRVIIGRVIVQTASTVPKSSPPKPPPIRPSLSLDAYLHQQ